MLAQMAELADAVDSKSTDESLVGSTPTLGTLLKRERENNGTEREQSSPLGQREWRVDAGLGNLEKDAVPRSWRLKTNANSLVRWLEGEQLGTSGCVVVYSRTLLRLHEGYSPPNSLAT